MQPANAREFMVSVAAREIGDGELVFVGMRLPLLAFMLAQATHAPRAVGLYENGVIRARAAASLLYTMSDPANVRGATRTGEMLEVMGLLQSGRVSLGFVGAAEVDRFGNLNSTRVRQASPASQVSQMGPSGNTTRLPGSGGAADIASLAKRLVVLLAHRRHRLVEKVHYRTSPGFGEGRGWRQRVGLDPGGPSAIITDRGVLRFHEETKEARLVSYHPLEPSSSPGTVAAETGWKLVVDAECIATPPPTEEDLTLLRRMDPEGFWLGES